MKIPTVAMLPEPFEWCDIPGGVVTLLRTDWESDEDYVRDGRLEVVVPAFQISRYLITNAQFAQFEVAEDGYRQPLWWDFLDEARWWHQMFGVAQPSRFAGPTLPRTDVSWYEAMAFTRWLSDQSGETITLPSDPQWQFAAQGLDRRAFPWGDDLPSPQLANYGWQKAGPTPVDAYPDGASPFGVQDMVGNVWEWCSTGFATGDHTGLVADMKRVVHGGGAFEDHDFTYFRVDYRAKLPPIQRAYNVGFRVVRTGA